MARRDFLLFCLRAKALKIISSLTFFDKQQVYAQNCNMFLHIIAMVN